MHHPRVLIIALLILFLRLNRKAPNPLALHFSALALAEAEAPAMLPADGKWRSWPDLERVAENLKKLKYNRLVAVAKKVGVKQAVAPGVKKTGKQLAEEVLKVLNA